MKTQQKHQKLVDKDMYDKAMKKIYGEGGRKTGAHEIKPDIEYRVVCEEEKPETKKGIIHKFKNLFTKNKSVQDKIKEELGDMSGLKIEKIESSRAKKTTLEEAVASGALYNLSNVEGLTEKQYGDLCNNMAMLAFRRLLRFKT